MKAQLVAITFVDFCSRVLGVGLTMGQLVVAKVAFDGVQPAALTGAERDVAREIFGPVDEVPREARRVVAAVLGRGSGKTMLAGYRALHAMLTSDASMLARGEHGFVLVVAPDKATARQLIRFAIGAAKDTPSISRLVTAETADGFSMKRPDGKIVTLEAIAASRGGSAGRGRTILGFILDESSFFFDEGHARNDADIFKALVPRLVRGGQALLLSTPWLDGGLLYTLYSSNFGVPDTALACRASTLVMRDHAPDVVANVQDEERRDPDNARREYHCEFLTGGAGTFFDAAAVDRCVRDDLVLPAAPSGRMHAGADTGFTSDSSAIAIVGREGNAFRLLALEELRPTRDTPLSPSRTVARFAEVAEAYRCKVIMADSHYKESIREHLSPRGLSLSMTPSGQEGKARTYLELKKLIHEGRIELPKHHRLIAQLKAVVSRPTPGGGMTLTSPRRAGGGHGDLVSALVCAAWAASASNGAAVFDPAFGRGIVLRRDCSYSRVDDDRIGGSALDILEWPSGARGSW